MRQEPLRFPPHSLSPHVAVIHPDEDMLDLLQVELEQHGLATRALMPTYERSFQALAPDLPAHLLLCVVGLSPPYPAGQALVAALAAAYPSCTLVLTAADPPAALAGWQGRVCSLVHETADIEQTVAAILAAVRKALARRLVGTEV